MLASRPLSVALGHNREISFDSEPSDVTTIVLLHS